MIPLRPVARVAAPTRWDGLRWFVGRWRRPIAAVLAGLAVWAGLSAVRTKQPPGRDVLVAARDLPAGAALGARDVRTVREPVAVVPPTALAAGAAVAGRSLAVAVPAGVPLTTAAFSLTAVLPPGTVATSVRLADPAAAALLHPGDHVDVLAAHGADDLVDSGGPGSAGGSGGSGGSGGGASAGAAATVVAAGVPVLSIPAPETAAGDQGGLVVVAATPAQATALAAAAAAERLSVTVRSG